MSEETEDVLFGGRLRVAQPARGARVTLDPFFLAHFATAEGRGGAAAELGAGTGVLSLLLATLDPRLGITAIEVSPGAARRARENVRRNGLTDRIGVLEADAAAPGTLPAGRLSLVVSNPPFLRAGAGRRSPDPARRLAREESSLTLGRVAAVARRALAPRGRLAVILPAARLAEAVTTLAATSLGVRRLRFVHSHADEAARRVLLEARRGLRGDTQVEPPLVVHAPDRRAFSPEAAHLLGVDR